MEPWRNRAALGGLVAGAALCLLLETPARGQDMSLDLERALQLALERNERAAQADQRSAAATARVHRARAFFFPDLTASGSYTRRAYETTRVVEGQRFTIQSRDALLGTATASLALFDPRAIPLYRSARRDEDAAQLQASEDKRLLQFEAADAFLITIGLEQVHAAAERRLEYATGALQDARARFDAGLVSSNDVSRAEVEAATAERVLTVARAGVEGAYLELGNLLDAQVAPPLVVPLALLEEAAAARPDTDTLAPTAVERRLDVAASRARAEALHFAAQEPLYRYLPSLGFAAQGRMTNERGLSGRDTDWSLGLNFTWPLYDGGERSAERKERLALAGVADLDVRAAQRRVDLEVQRAHVALRQAQEAMRAATTAVDAARRNAAEVTELYRQGLARALEVADAGLRLFDTEVALASERFGLGRAFLGLRAATGLDPLGRSP